MLKKKKKKIATKFYLGEPNVKIGEKITKNIMAFLRLLYTGGETVEPTF